MIGNLSGLGTFLVSRLKFSHAERGGDLTVGLRRSRQNGVSVVQLHKGSRHLSGFSFFLQF